MSKTIILDPAAAIGTATHAPWRALDSLQGKIVGFIDNSKPNFNHLADDLAQLLVARYGAASVIRHRKRSASIPVAESALDEMARKCDLVITGSGD
ncbi:MAG: hypothetical protein GEV05_28395 [Betaproteobacteria bacterium]|nr:hypothetical protein [Betaproteobacteria bacterium]